jgi:RNase P subunit RPR2
MTLNTICKDCRAPIIATLDEATTTEAEAQDIAARLYCVPCAIQRTLAVTAVIDSQNTTQARPTEAVNPQSSLGSASDVFGNR